MSKIRKAKLVVEALLAIDDSFIDTRNIIGPRLTVIANVDEKILNVRWDFVSFCLQSQELY